MKPISDKKVEFIARTITDMGKAMWAVGIASYFFEKFPFVWRVGLGIVSFVLMIIGIWMFPDKGGDD